MSISSHPHDYGQWKNHTCGWQAHGRLSWTPRALLFTTFHHNSVSHYILILFTAKEADQCQIKYDGKPATCCSQIRKQKLLHNYQIQFWRVLKEMVLQRREHGGQAGQQVDGCTLGKAAASYKEHLCIQRYREVLHCTTQGKTQLCNHTLPVTTVTRSL